MNSTTKQLFSGVSYTAASQYFGIFISLLVSGILARLISPEEFGVVAIATVLITFFGIFSELGIAPAIVQTKNLSEEDLDKIFSFTIWMGLVISLLFLGSSFLISHYYDNWALLSICQLLSINLFFAAINIVPNGLMFKNKEFKFVAIRSVLVQLVGGTIAVCAACMGAGIYALVINPIFSSLFIFMFSYKRFPLHPQFTLGLDAMKKIASFSLYQFFFNVINYFSRNLDKLLIGKFMSMSLLGYYDKSYRLMMLPLQNITAVLTPVMHPILSDFQDDLPRLERSYLKIIRLLAFVGFPLSAFLWFSGYEIMLLIFGDRWEFSVPAFRILALSVGVQIILSSSGSIFQAANSTKTMFVSGLLSAVLNVISILVGIFVFNSLEAVAWCICISFFINFIQCYILMYTATFKMGMGMFWKQFIAPLLLTALLVVVSIVLFAILDTTLMISLVIKSIVYLVIFIFYIQVSKEFDIIGKIKSLRKKV
ncbi:MAG: hypothetical protein RL662_1172 [Bacteroidota bacterium]|jgi:PST family polysaccharide transporter